MLVSYLGVASLEKTDAVSHPAPKKLKLHITALASAKVAHHQPQRQLARNAVILNRHKNDFLPFSELHSFKDTYGRDFKFCLQSRIVAKFKHTNFCVDTSSRTRVIGWSKKQEFSGGMPTYIHTYIHTYIRDRR